MIHISLEGIVKTKEEQKMLIEHIKKVCDEQQVIYSFEQNQGSLYLCPNGVIEIQFDHYYMTAKANSAAVGAGYHVAVCELFEAIQKESPLYLTIDDECEYIEDKDFERIQENYFMPYMARLMDCFSKMKEEDEATYLWDDKSYLPVSKENHVITPLGYIQGKDCGKYSLKEAMDQFYIWNHIEKDALFYRNSALVSLWCDCLFENSIYDEKGINVAKSICNALEKAHELDPTLALPVDEYQLLCKGLNRKNQILNVQQFPNKKIGYRRDDIFYVYGGWLFYFQGNALQSFDGHTMTLEIKDQESVHLSMKITGYKNHEKMDFAYRYLNTVDALDQVDFETNGIHVKGVLHQLNDESSTLYLQAQCLKDKEMMMVNVECSDMSYYQKALVTLENVLNISTESTSHDVRL